MTCTGCGSNNAYTGNCGCSEPIELICTGPPGATGAPGPAGADGIALFDNIIVPKWASIGVAFETIYSKVIPNTAILQEIDIGSYFVIEGFCRYNNPDNIQRSYKLLIRAGTTTLIEVHMLVVSSGSANMSGNHYFRAELHRRTSTEYIVREAAAWGDSYNAYGIAIPTVYRFAPQESSVINFLTDITIDVTLYKNTNTGTPVTFNSATEAGLVGFEIIKYVK